MTHITPIPVLSCQGDRIGLSRHRLGRYRDSRESAHSPARPLPVFMPPSPTPSRELPPHLTGADHGDPTIQSQDVLLAMAVYSLDLIAYIAPDETYRAVNQTWLDYWGCSKSDVVGLSVRDRLGEKAYEEEVAPLLKRALAGERVSFQHLVHFHARGPRFMEIALIPDTAPDGAVKGMVLRSHDIHLQHEREVLLESTLAALEQRNAEQQRFIRVLSHDLREPVNAVRNFASLLVSDHSQDLPAPARRYLGYVSEGGERMKQILDDLTDLLQLDTYEPRFEVFDLGTLVSEVIDGFHDQIVSSKAVVTVGPMDRLRADPSLIRIALQAYIGNGLKFTKHGQAPRIHITLESIDDGMHIAVQDQGLGIAPQQQSTLFDMFRRLHSRQRYAGAGLGLSVCRRIAQLHGGRVTLQSTLGQGSCFGIVIPSNQHTTSP